MSCEQHPGDDEGRRGFPGRPSRSSRMTGVGAASGAILQVTEPARDPRGAVATGGMGKGMYAVDSSSQGRQPGESIPHRGLLVQRLVVGQTEHHGESSVGGYYDASTKLAREIFKLTSFSIFESVTLSTRANHARQRWTRTLEHGDAHGRPPAYYRTIGCQRTRHGDPCLEPGAGLEPALAESETAVLPTGRSRQIPA